MVQQSGSVGIGFVFDDSHSHKIFQSIYGADANGSSPFIYPSKSRSRRKCSNITVSSITTQIQVATSGSASLEPEY